MRPSYHSIYRFSTNQLVTRTTFKTQPAALYSFFQKRTQEGPTENNLVVLHGLFGSHTNFRTILKNPLISNQADTYSVDLRNHGFSQHMQSNRLEDLGDDIVNYLEEKQMRNVILMGHSLGGRAILSALKHHQKSLESMVKGVVICDIAPSNLLTDRTADVMEMWIMINQLLDIHLEGKAKTTIEKEVRNVIANPQVASFMIMNIIPDEENPGNYRWRMNLPAIQATYRENLSVEIKDANWQGPAHIICGARSHYVNEKKIAEFATIFPNLDAKKDVHFIHGAGHWVHADKPVEFTQILADFIGTLPNQH